MSPLLCEPAELTGLVSLRRMDENWANILEAAPDLLLSGPLFTLAPSLRLVVSDSVFGSMCDCGKMPYLPFELLPYQHQCSA